MFACDVGERNVLRLGCHKESATLFRCSGFALAEWLAWLKDGNNLRSTPWGAPKMATDVFEDGEFTATYFHKRKGAAFRAAPSG